MTEHSIRVMSGFNVVAVLLSDARPANVRWWLQTVAEKKAWELSEKLGFDLVTIMPSLVLGPVTGNRNDGTSLNVMKVCRRPLIMLPFHCAQLFCASTSKFNRLYHLRASTP